MIGKHAHTPRAADADENQALACQLTTPELRERKATVIAGLKQRLLKREELPDGFSYEFNGSDEMIDELVSFIKAERACCGFFTFQLSVGRADNEFLTLAITGPAGAKEFIISEMEL